MTTLYINSLTKLLCRPAKRVWHLLTALLLVMATIPSHAQFFKQIGMGDGLSNPVVLAIYQDTLQRMWFGTNEGVNIYDGNDMVQSKSYGVQQVLLPSGGMEQQPIFNGIVNKIVGNSKGDVFLLSSGSLVRYNLKKDCFIQLKPSGIGTLQRMGDEVWCAQGSSIYCYDSAADSLRLVRHLHIPKIWCLQQAGDKIYVGTAEGLYVWQGDEVREVIPEVEIFRLFYSSRGELWVGTRMKGLYRLDGKGILHYENEQGGRIVSNQIREFAEDERHRIWFGTFNGLQVYDPYSESYGVHRPNGMPGSLSHPSVFSVYRDRQGSIWLGSHYGGVNYFNGMKDLFTLYPYVENRSGGLSFPIVGEMVEDVRHDLWIATDGGGVNRLDHTEGQIYSYKASPSTFLHNNVKSLAYDRERDDLYIGTYTGGLCRYSCRTGRYYNYLSHLKEDEGPNAFIYSVSFKQGKLYVTARNGFWMLDPDAQQFELISRQELFLIFEIDHHGYYWLATEYQLFKMKTDDPQRTLIPLQQEGPVGRVKVTDIEVASDGTVYLSTLGSGLYAYRYDTDSWSHFTKEEHFLQSNYCYGVKETAMNHILVTSDKGASIYSPFNRTSYFLGLMSKEGITAITEGCGLYVAEDERVYIGGVNGMVSFWERALYAGEETNCRFYFSKLYVNNEAVMPGDGHGVLNESLPFVHHVKLSCDQKNIKVSFAHANYILSERNEEFFYKLEGYDKGWAKTLTPWVNYTNLAPGHYVLKVRHKAGGWKNELGEEIALSISIGSPWYATWWAVLGWIALTLAVTFSFYRVRRGRLALAASLAREKEEKDRMEELNRMKLRFFTNISHEFRTPLTLIMGQVEMLLQQEKPGSVMMRRLQGVYRNAMSLRGLITELLDFRKLEQGFMKLKVHRVDAVDFTRTIYLQFVEYARKRGIAYSCHHPDGAVDLWLDSGQMRKVVLNLLSNAFKHTPQGGTIEVSVHCLHRQVQIAVRDTGSGIPEEQLQRIFERFYQVDEEKEDKQTGSGIGLALAKGIVDAHHGELRVESRVGEGSCFTISLPMGHAHFTEEELYSADRQKLVKESSAEGTLNREGERLSEDYTWDIVASLREVPSEDSSHPEADLSNETEALSHSLGQQTAQGQSVDSDRQRPLLLIVEDDDEMRRMLVEILAPTYEVAVASNGREGFEQALQIRPDLIVSDVMMPEMDGKEMCYKIKNCLEMAYTPVILLTAQVSDEHTVEGFMFGADDYITKPFPIKLLLVRCDNLLRNKRIFLKKMAAAASQGVLAGQPSGPGTGDQMSVQVGEGVAEMSHVSAADRKVLDNAVQIIRRNFDNSEFDMNVLASELHLGRSKMFTLLKELTGLTPNEFTMKLKMEEALRLLKEEPQYNIAEISYQLGFSSPRYFSRCFKDFYGQSPMNCRQEKKV